MASNFDNNIHFVCMLSFVNFLSVENHTTHHFHKNLHPPLIKTRENKERFLAFGVLVSSYALSSWTHSGNVQ